MNIYNMINKDVLERALSFLTLNCSFVSDLGLFHGKMGSVLFFAHYARHFNDDLYDDFAGELLDEIYEDIQKDTPVNLESGLCGIGWGVEYLQQNGFLEGDADLANIDLRIMECDIRHISDLSFRRGLAGIVFYVITRLSSSRKKETLPFSESYLSTLKEVLLSVNFSEADEVPPFLFETFLSVLSGVYLGKPKLSDLFIISESELSVDLSSASLGLEKGIAGKLYYLLFVKTND